jgi:hypothetical protein
VTRTTLDIDRTVLSELRRRGREQGRTLGELASELLEQGLAAEDDRRSSAPFRWKAQRMGARVDLEDDDALRQVLGDA